MNYKRGWIHSDSLVSMWLPAQTVALMQLNNLDTVHLNRRVLSLLSSALQVRCSKSQTSLMRDHLVLPSAPPSMLGKKPLLCWSAAVVRFIGIKPQCSKMKQKVCECVVCYRPVSCNGGFRLQDVQQLFIHHRSKQSKQMKPLQWD